MGVQQSCEHYLPNNIQDKMNLKKFLDLIMKDMDNKFSYNPDRSYQVKDKKSIGKFTYELNNNYRRFMFPTIEKHCNLMKYRIIRDELYNMTITKQTL